MSEIREECGVFGIYSPQMDQNVAPTVYYGLFALQHRGQESCGIVVNNRGVFKDYRDSGLVNDVFDHAIMDDLGLGNIAVGHVRYGTTGTSDRINAQPIVVHRITGSMALAHNGNLVNSLELRKELEQEGSIFQTTSDTEVISYVIIKERISSQTIEEAVERSMKRIEGAYSLVIMTGSKLIAVRDPNGFRPLCYGKTSDGSYVVASESCALDAVGADFIRDVEPGEILVFSKDGMKSIQTDCSKAKKSLCVFEYIYFARPDSVIEGVCVHEARAKAGEFLAEEHPVEADVVIGVPDSGLDAAIGYSRKSGIPYGIGFIKNKYIGRTFIAPGQETREDKVKIKLNVIPSVVKGKRVVMIDDSIVRGTTSGRIVKLLREAGATEVHMRVSAPPFMNPCYYGTDIDSRENLIACQHTVPEIAELIGADSLGFLSIEHVLMLADNKKCDEYCAACFNGKYPTKIPADAQKDRFEQNLEKRG